MNEIITHTIGSLKLGGVLLHENMVVFPMTREGIGGPAYLTMSEAMAEGLVAVTEVDAHGSVPNLLVTSKAGLPVLILDGEELRGAKQNRVLNTSILIPPAGKVVVPVSCTEHGRWNSVSNEFADGDVIMFSRARMAKQMSVSGSLRMDNAFTGDQGEVWQDIAALHESLGTHSETGAMGQAFEDQRQQMDEYLKAFPLQKDQTGLFIMIDGEIVGFDVLSRPEAYMKLHDKLVRSYVMDALVHKHSRQKKTKPEASSLISRATAFLEEILQCQEQKHASVGLGDDYRYSHEKMSGAALEYERTVIHMAFFRQTDGAKDGDILHWGHRHRGPA